MAAECAHGLCLRGRDLGHGQRTKNKHIRTVKREDKQGPGELLRSLISFLLDCFVEKLERERRCTQSSPSRRRPSQHLFPLQRIKMFNIAICLHWMTAEGFHLAAGGDLQMQERSSQDRLGRRSTVWYRVWFVFPPPAAGPCRPFHVVSHLAYCVPGAIPTE